MNELGHWTLSIKLAAQAAGFRLTDEQCVSLGTVACKAYSEGHAAGLVAYPNMPGNEAEAARLRTIEIRKGESIGVCTPQQIREERTLNAWLERGEGTRIAQINTQSGEGYTIFAISIAWFSAPVGVASGIGDSLEDSFQNALSRSIVKVPK